MWKRQPGEIRRFFSSLIQDCQNVLFGTDSCRQEPKRMMPIAADALALTWRQFGNCTTYKKNSIRAAMFDRANQPFGLREI